MASVNGLWQLYGLTSYGYGCALAGSPGVYTRISYYVSWIKSNIQLPETTATTVTKELTTSTTNETNHTAERNHSTESVSQMSNIAKRSTVQSFIATFFLPIITSAYSILLLFLL
jgi:secreted trypsin-like serine protease